MLVGKIFVDGNSYDPESPKKSKMSQKTGLDRKTPYTTIGIYPEVRGELESLRDEHGFENYSALLLALTQNAEGGLLD